MISRGCSIARIFSLLLMRVRGVNLFNTSAIYLATDLSDTINQEIHGCKRESLAKNAFSFISQDGEEFKKKKN